MNLTYVIDYVFRQTPDGTVWTDTSYDAEFWQPYINVYGSVTLLCRVERVAAAAECWKQVTGDRISVVGVQAYRGALGYVLKSGKVKQAIRRALSDCEAVILRMPSNLARCVAQEMRSSKLKYAVEVVGDPEEALAPGVVHMAGRPLFRSIFVRAQKTICATAAGVTYVARVLQGKYPAPAGAPSLVCSDVRLDEEWLRPTPRHFEPSLHRRLITVATLSQTYKGIDLLLRALRICRDHNFDLSLTIVGAGRYRKELERQADKLELKEQVTFTGAVPWGPELIAKLDAADIFILPSRVEVLPRALLEAMARGLPAIATDVGAVHEVLSPTEMVTPGDAVELAHRIMHMQTSSRRLEALSSRNLARAHEFSAHKLQPRWQTFQEELLRTLDCKVPKRWRKVARPNAA